MKIELNNKKSFQNGNIVEEIHPFWLRERANGDKFIVKVLSKDYLIPQA